MFSPYQVVIWCLAGNIIGYFCLSGRSAHDNRPPTWMRPSLARNELSAANLLLLDTGCLFSNACSLDSKHSRCVIFAIEFSANSSSSTDNGPLSLPSNTFVLKRNQYAIVRCNFRVKNIFSKGRLKTVVDTSTTVNAFVSDISTSICTRWGYSPVAIHAGLCHHNSLHCQSSTA